MRQEARKWAEIGRNANAFGRRSGRWHVLPLASESVGTGHTSFIRRSPPDGLGIDSRELKQLRKDLLVG